MDASILLIGSQLFHIVKLVIISHLIAAFVFTQVKLKLIFIDGQIHFEPSSYGINYWGTKETSPSQWKDTFFHVQKICCCSSLAWSWDRYRLLHYNDHIWIAYHTWSLAFLVFQCRTWSTNNLQLCKDILVCLVFSFFILVQN